MKKVSFAAVESLLAPISVPEEPLYSELAATDGSDEGSVRMIIRSHLKPYFESFDERSRAIISDSLQYCLSVPGFPVDRPFQSGEIPFDPPEPVIDFYRWVAEELLGSPASIQKDDYQVIKDLSLAHQLKRRK